MSYKSTIGRGSGKLIPVFKSTDSGIGIGGGSVAIAPNINSVTIVGSAGTTRYTNKVFYVNANVLNDGSPISTKSVKIWVTGTQRTATQTGIVTSIETTIPVTNYSSYLVGSGYVNPTFAFDNTEGTSAQSQTQNQNGAFSTFKWLLTGGLTIPCKTFQVNGAASNYPSYAMPTIGCTFYFSDSTSQSGALNQVFTVPNGKKIIGFECSTGFAGNGYYTWAMYINSVYVDGYLLQNNDKLLAINVNSSNDLGRIQSNDILTQATTGAAGTVRYADTTNKIIYFSGYTGNWANSYAATGTPKLTSTTTLYPTINNAGSITGFSTTDAGDSGFYASSTTLPISITFPALMPSGQTPDFELQSDTSITATLKISNSAGSEQLTSNSITPT